ncbi:RNA polymerase sigma factor [Ramlibacter sp. G-1-2-2]|uniref:RNA polymerase sigma factor n=1 Tax=Ramlibacter agri TaxID=2728837 RepID=A0A848HBX5_9BURK|nr:RNA polymerase sigma factor [Ramlibacter agri]NML46003.1 RNA polymerase sigma factor [Ramlibacter agri]
MSLNSDPALRADDEALRQRAAAGDARAFEALMRRHNRLLFRTARSVLRNDPESEEVVQEAYLKAWRALPGFRGDSQLSTWLVRIVMNEALGRLRRSRTAVVPIGPAALAEPDEVTEEAADPAAAAAHDPEQAALRGELRRIVETHIDQLPEQFRTVFMLRAVEEMNVEEVAAALQVPAATVRTRFFRARALLRTALERELDFAIDDAFSFAGARCDRIVATVLRRIAQETP